MGYCSKCFYGINRANGREIAIKFALNHKTLIDYNKEEILINKLSDVNFYPKLCGFNNDDKKEYLAMTLMGPDLEKIHKFSKNGFFEKEVIRDIGLELLNLLEYIHGNKYKNIYYK